MVPHASWPAARAAQPRVLRQQPAELGSREIRVEHQAGALAEPRLVGLALAAEVGGAAVLPDDRRRHRPAAGPLPQHHRLALIGQADRGQPPRFNPRLGQRLRDHFAHRRPDFLGVVFHPARPRVVLRQLAGGGAEGAAGRVVHHRAGAGRALIDGQYGSGRHRSVPPGVCHGRLGRAEGAKSKHGRDGRGTPESARREKITYICIEGRPRRERIPVSRMTAPAAELDPQRISSLACQVT